MSNIVTTIFGGIGHWLFNLCKALGGQLKIDTETFLKSFVKDDLGKIAIDAANIIGAEGLQDVAARDAAIALFIKDATAAGHDVTTFATSTLNWFIETAVQAIKAEIAVVSA